MAAQMPMTIPTGGSKNLSSTAKIMIDLFQRLHEDALKISNDNPAILKGALLDGMLGQLESKLKEIKDLSSAQDNINHIVTTLENGSKEAQQAASLLTPRQAALDEKVKDAYKTRDSLEQKLVESQKVIGDMIDTILSTLTELDDEKQKEKSRSMDITGQFETAQKNTEKLDSQVQKFVNDCNALSGQLDSLHTSLFAVLPSHEKQSAPRPPSDATPGQRHGG